MFSKCPLLTQYLIWLEGTQMHKVKCNDQYMKTVGLLEETFFIQVKFTNIDGQNKRNRKNVPSSVWTYQSNSCSYTLGSISTVQQQYISLQDNVQVQKMQFTASYALSGMNVHVTATLRMHQLCDLLGETQRISQRYQIFCQRKLQ